MEAESRGIPLRSERIKIESLRARAENESDPKTRATLLELAKHKQKQAEAKWDEITTPKDVNLKMGRPEPTQSVSIPLLGVLGSVILFTLAALVPDQLMAAVIASTAFAFAFLSGVLFLFHR